MKLENASTSKLLNNDHPRIEDGPTFARDYLQETTNPLYHYRETRFDDGIKVALFLGYALFFFLFVHALCNKVKIMRV